MTARASSCKPATIAIGSLRGHTPASPPTRLAEVGGDDDYVYASDAGLFEPLADRGDEVMAGQPAGRIQYFHTPWREPGLVMFRHDGFVVCKRVPALCKRGDCLFHLATAITA